MTTTLNPVPQSETAGSTVYFVVPLLGGDDPNLEPCFYFDTEWNRVAANDLTTKDDTDHIVLVEQAHHLPERGLKELSYRQRKPDLDATLFAAVAKTLDVQCNLPNTYVAAGPAGGASVSLPVKPKTRRGVVLIFKRPQTGGTEALIATADPEIRNSSGS